MNKLISTTLCAGLLLISMLSNAESAMRQIEVNGVGKISEQPDMAITSFTFSQRSQVAAQGKKLIDTQVDNLLKLCEKLGIDSADIQAAKLTLYPRYDHQNRRQLLDYQVAREVQVKVRDLRQYPRLLEGAVGIGASHSGNLQLEFSDRDALENRAMIKAFQQAKHKAELLAEQANSKLGQVVWLSESGNGSPPMPLRMAATAESLDAAYPTGEVEISKRLVVRFSLKD